MNGQHFHGRVDQVAGHDITNHHHVHVERAMPPEGSEAAISCPQCNRSTWRQSQFCIHCDLDLVAHRRQAHRVVVRKRLHRFAATLAGAATVLIIFGALAHPKLAPFCFVGAAICTAGAVRTMDDSIR